MPLPWVITETVRHVPATRTVIHQSLDPRTLATLVRGGLGLTPEGAIVATPAYEVPDTVSPPILYWVGFAGPAGSYDLTATW